MINFDQFLDQRLKNGKFQYAQLAILSMTQFIDGLEAAFLGLLIIILRKEWDLNMNQVMLLGTSFFLGISLGALIGGMISNHFGRRNTVVCASFAQVILLLITSRITTFTTMFYIRIAYGLLFGLTLVIPSILITELVTKMWRGRFIIITFATYELGKIYLIILCFFYLEDYETGNWRGMILVNVWPAILVFIGSLLFLFESPRLNLIKEQYCRAFSTMNRMGQINQENMYQKLNYQEVNNDIVNSIEERLVGQVYLGLEENRLTNKCFFLGVVYEKIHCEVINVGNIGAAYLLTPFLLQQENQGFEILLISYTGQMLASSTSYFIVDDQNIGGRKCVLLVTSSCLMILQFLLYSTRGNYIAIIITCINVFTKMTRPMVNLLAAESYPTYIRDKGAAVILGLSFLSSSLSPFILFPLYYIDPYLPYLILTFFALGQIIITAFYPIEKTQEDLEENLFVVQSSVILK